MATKWHPDLLISGAEYRVHVNLHMQKLAVAKLPFRAILCYVDDITLDSVTFVVQNKCVDTIEKTGVRQVCAYARGRLVAVNSNPSATDRNVRYNPLVNRYFHDPENGERINAASRVVFIDKHAYIIEVPDCPPSGKQEFLPL